MEYNYKSELFNVKSTSFAPNYQKWLQYYIKFIERCKQRKWSENDGPFEIHHIVPRSWDGPNCQENLIKLPILYHMIAHCYLYHTLDTRMVHAFSCISKTTTSEYCNNYIIITRARACALSILSRQRKIVNLTTGQIYPSVKEASRSVGYKWPCGIRVAIRNYLPCKFDNCYWQYADCITDSYSKEIEKIMNKRKDIENARKTQTWRLKNTNTEPMLVARRKSVIRLQDGVVFESIVAAAKSNGVATGSIQDAIERKAKSANSYWMFYSDYDSTKDCQYYNTEFDTIANQRSIIHQTAVIDTTTNTRYASMKEAAKAMNVHPNAIAEAVKTGHKCCGHLWTIENGKQRDFRVVEMNSMQVYNTKKEASEKTGISKNSITRSTLTDKPVKGTLWKNFNELDPQTQKQLLK